VSARDYVVAVLVAGGVAAEVACCLGLLALRNAAGTVGPALVAGAVCVREGVVSSQGLNSILIAALLAVGGAALSGGTIRMIRLHDRDRLGSTPAERERG
jgi:hypothetical protein